MAQSLQSGPDRHEVAREERELDEQRNRFRKRMQDITDRKND